MQTCEPGRLRLFDHLWPLSKQARNLISLIRQDVPSQGPDGAGAQGV